MDLKQLEIRTATIQDLARLDHLSKSVRSRQRAQSGTTSLLRIDEAYLRARLSRGMMLVATIGNRVVGVSTMMLKSDNNTRYCSDSVTMVAPSLTRKKIGEKLFEARIKWARENDVEFITTCIVSKEGYNFLEAMSEKFTELEFDIREFGCSRISLRRPAP